MAGALRISGLRSALAGPFDVAIEPGQAVAVTGRSGSGKSLFLRMVADLDPNEGSVRLGAEERRGMPAPRWRRLVTYVAAETGWWEESVAAHFAPAEREQAAELADRLGLAPRARRRPRAAPLDGGEAAPRFGPRLWQSPPVLLLDEPHRAARSGERRSGGGACCASASPRA